MTTVIPFPALRTPRPRIAPSIAESDAIVSTGSKTILAKITVTFTNGPTNLPPKKAQRNPPH